MYCRMILAFDIGIKNLAWCCGQPDASGCIIAGWANENLISGGTADSDLAAMKCSCGKTAGFFNNEKGYCVRHCPPLTPALRDLSGSLLKKIPSLIILKALAVRDKAAKEDLKNKNTVLAFLNSRYCFPRPVTAVKKVDLETLHDGIRKMIVKNSAIFSKAQEILLENQPVLKNPVMKSVQMMLFASLRDLLESPKGIPHVRLVHAGRKTAGATKGDDGYAERKGASEARVLKGFADRTIRWAEATGGTGAAAQWFTEQKKRSDLADCLCMVLDAAKSKA